MHHAGAGGKSHRPPTFPQLRHDTMAAESKFEKHSEFSLCLFSPAAAA